MVRAPAVLTALLALLVPLSGCLGTGSVSVTSTGPELRVDATVGALTGQVLSASLEPIPSASILARLSSADVRSVLTDVSGKFSLGDLPPGTYTIQAAALGFMPTQTTQAVVAGAVAELRLLLEAAPIDEPYSVRKDFAGFMSIGFATLDGSAAFSGQGLDENHDTSFDIDVVPADLETFIVEMEWRDESLLMQLDVWAHIDCSSSCRAEVELGAGQGQGEIVIRLDRPAGGWEGLTPAGDTIWLFAWTSSNDAQPASAGYQVPFDVYTEAFYGAPAPAAHRVRADG